MPPCTLRLPYLYPKQREAIFNPARYAVIEASTKAGKTVGCITWILSEAWSKGRPGRNWWWIAPIYPQAKIAYRRMRRMLHRTDPTKTIWSSNDSELRIHLNGQDCDIWFKGSDDPDSLYGEDVHGAVIDEASRCKEDSWYAVRSTLTATNGLVRVIGNVKGRKNWAYKLGAMARSGEPGMSYAKITAYDAVEGGVLSMQEIEDAKKILPEQVFNELFLAEPSDDGGNPFRMDAIKACRKRIENPGKIVQHGVDLAKKQDWTVDIGLDDAGRVVKFDRWQLTPWGETTSRLAQNIGDTHALVDSTGVGDAIVDGLQKRCPLVEGYVFSLPSKQRLMECLAVALQSGEVAYDDDLIQQELESFEYEYTRTGVRYTAPEGFHDDCVYALALAVYGRQMRPRIVIASSNPPSVANEDRGQQVSRMVAAERKRADDWLRAGDV